MKNTFFLNILKFFTVIILSDIFIFFYSVSYISASNNKTDSLQALYEKQIDDVARIKILLKLFNEYYKTDIQKAIECGNNILKLRSKIRCTRRFNEHAWNFVPE
ncbi:MAG: hypothetical protein HY738_07925 [Bacteroidia bacterium]|nr:hypothetical protein [Bacteroidia bacterium]